MTRTEAVLLLVAVTATVMFAQSVSEKPASIQSAIIAACNGSNHASVVLPAGTFVVSSISVPSNCTIVGKGPRQTILQADISLNSPVLLISSVSHVELVGVSLDGGCSRSGVSCMDNRNAFDLIRIVHSTDINIDDVEVRDASGNGINIQSGNRRLTIRNSEADGVGSALPAVGGAGFNIGSGDGDGNSHIQFFNDSAHDGNLGFYVQSSKKIPSVSEDITFEDIRSYANANDGWAVFTQNASYAPIRGVRVQNSESYCNGWPSNGVGFSADCAPGMLQTGSIPSSSGVGFDFNSAVLSSPIVIGNRSHDNLIDGFAFSGYTVTRVNCTHASNSVCTSLSGDPFNTNWKKDQTIRIGSYEYQILSVSSAFTLTLQQDTDALNGAYLDGSSFMFASIVANQSYSNGTIDEGAGFWNNGADSNSYSANISRLNFQDGFGCDGSAFLTYSGDKAYSNGRSPRSRHDGFLSQGCIDNSYWGVSADDPASSPTQLVSIYLDAATTGTLIETSSVFTNPVWDLGKDNFYNWSERKSEERSGPGAKWR